MAGGFIQIVGFTTDDKVPGAYGETIFGAGTISAASLPMLCLLVGTKLSSGSATANQDIDPILSKDDADDLYGAGSELAVMCYSALDAAPGVTLYAAATAEAGGAAAATATITIDGTWTTTGEWRYWIDGKFYTGSIASTDSVQNVADAIAAAISANQRAPVTAASASGSGTTYVVTLTRKSKGARGNDGSLYQDSSKLPSGATSVIAGGTSISGGGKRFTGGSGTESLSTLLTVLTPGLYERIGVASNDTASLYTASGANWRDYLATKAGVLEGRMEHLLYGVTSTLSAANTLANAVNDQRMEGVWLKYCENHPSEIAAAFAAIRSVSEGANPNTNYDDVVIPGIVAQRVKSDWSNHATLKSALNNGVTPLMSLATGKVSVCRAITSHSLDGATPDYRTLDVAESAVPDWIRKDLVLYYRTTVKPENPYVMSDPAEGEKARPAGVLTPSLWNADIEGKESDYEQALLITNLPGNKPTSQYNSTAKRIMSLVPIEVLPQNHQVGISVRQVNNL